MDISEEELQQKILDAVNDATTGLSKKNQELLAELKEARKGKTIDPAEVDRLQAKIDQLETDLATGQKTLKEGNKAYEKLKASFDSESAFTSKLLLDNGLSDALVKANVASQFLPAVKAMLGTQAKILVDGDSRKAVIGDKDLAEFVSAWATSDEGKHYIAAPANGGGGASGGAGNGSGAKVWTREQFDTKSHYERAEFAKSGGKVID